MADDPNAVLRVRRCHRCAGDMRPSKRTIIAPGLAVMRYACIDCSKNIVAPEKPLAIALGLAGFAGFASTEPLFVVTGLLAMVVPYYVHRRNPLLADRQTSTDGDAHK